MATSSLYKTFSLKTKEETNAFMEMFEQALKNPPKIEPSGVKMATEGNAERLVKALEKKYGNNSSV